MRMLLALGLWWMGMSLLYGHQLMAAYGRGLPKTMEEWMGEFLAAMLAMVGSVFLALDSMWRSRK